MERQARVLQHRVQAAAVRRRREGAQERVGGEQDEQQEADADHALHRQHPRPQRRRQVVGEHGDRGADTATA